MTKKKHPFVALLLALGEFSETRVLSTGGQNLLAYVNDFYENHPDGGIHGAQNGCSAAGAGKEISSQPKSILQR